MEYGPKSGMIDPVVDDARTLVSYHTSTGSPLAGAGRHSWRRPAEARVGRVSAADVVHSLTEGRPAEMRTYCHDLMSAPSCVRIGG